MKGETRRFSHAAVATIAALGAGAPALAAVHCPGEIDNLVIDGRTAVNIFDFGELAATFGDAVPPGTGADLDASGVINIFDFGILAASFGCEATLYEPGTLHPAPATLPQPDIDSGTTFAVISDDILNQLFASMRLQGRLTTECRVARHLGEFVAEDCDTLIRGRGHDFRWCRTYRSSTGPDTPMGNGWDHGYNIFIEPSGADLILHDGNARADLYENQAPGLWTDEEFFRNLEQEPDLSFTLTFPHGDTWSLHPLDGSPQQGRISAITDRNGNAITFEYDGIGRLAIIRDTLDDPANPREIIVDYNPDGLIQSVTDFTGRQVTYEYYDGIEPGGNAGDLKSVTTPAVVGTPNGNDFPAGKTTVYTYSTGFDNERLNHNLLTITDPKGQTYCTTEYAPTIAPEDLEFDRVTRQTLGDPGDLLDFVYTPLTPEEANGFACVKVTVNDRVGNVSEHFYDDGARLVIVREHTGRADPDLPTDLDNAVNPPGPPLRPDDPALFETRLEWNADSLCTRAVHPNGNETLTTYDELNPDRRSQGNLLQRTWLPGPLGGDQPLITEQWQYDPVLNFGSNFATSHTDGRSNTTSFEYDSRGNLTRVTHRIPTIVEDFAYNAFGQLTRHTLPDNGSGHRREDAFTYYTPADGCMNGYLRDRTIDDTALALTTTYEYDCLGRMTRITDPRGNDSLHEYNALDQVVRSQSREVTTVNPVRYERLHFYDANDNVVRVDRSNHDDQGTLDPANTHFTTIYEYEILNRVTRVCAEEGAEQLDTIDDDCGVVDPNEFVTTEYEYDDNRNRTRVRFGAAVSDPDNEVRCLYDERDLVFEETRAPDNPVRSTTRYTYDGNRNVVLVLRGAEADTSPHYPGDAGRLTVCVWDGYDRLVRLVDPMENVHICEYDAAGNRTRTEVQGEENDAPGDAGNVRLYEESCDYDAMDRCTSRTAEHYDTATQTPIGDGQSRCETGYSDCSQPLTYTDDNSNTTTCTYDTANRCSSVTDARGNSVAYIYDPNSNPTQITETDKSDLGNPDEVFTTTYAYDSLDRRIRIVDPVGNQTDSLYDSRNNTTETVDPLGNTTRYAYDGLDRLIRIDRALTDTGDGGGTVTGTATTRYTYDDSSRMTAFEDDNSHTTTYEYDPLNRLIRLTRADTTERTYAYDHHDNVIQTTDPNGSAVTYEYDLLDRRTITSVAPGPGVSNDTTFENYLYDGLSRLVAAQDDDSTVTFAYDSLSNRTQESAAHSGAPPHSTTSSYDGWGNRLTCVYPGGRTLDYIYDSLNRVDIIQEGGLPHATAEHLGGLSLTNAWSTETFGPIGVRLGVSSGSARSGTRIERMTYSNGTQTDFAYDGVANSPGDFGVRQIIGKIHTGPIAGIFDERSYTWDPSGNKSTQDVLAGPPPLETEYVYDSIYRMTRSTTVDPATTGVTRDTTYDLDDVGNRNSESGSFGSGGYLLDPTLLNPGDFQVNQYTLTPLLGNTHDDNGNLSQTTHANTLEQVTYAYDYLDRLVSITDVSTGDVTEYEYDPLGRRVRTIEPGEETRYYYDGSNVIEERNQLDVPQATFVWGEGPEFSSLIKSVESVFTGFISMQRGGQDFFAHCDDLGSTVALTDAAGNVVERYHYTDYGRPLILWDKQAPDEPQGALVSDADPVPFGSAEQVAENVVLGAQPVTAIRWWGGYSAVGLPPDDTFAIRIYEDAGGLPGALLHEELGITQAGRVLNGLSFGFPERVYLYELARPFTPPIPGAQYWISIQNDTSADPTRVWAWTISADGDGQLAISSGGGPFTPEPFDVAVEIFTDQSLLDNPYLFHGMRYDVESRQYYDESSPTIRYAPYYDPSTGRSLTRQGMDSLGNDRAYAGNNPTSRRGDLFEDIPDEAFVPIDIPIRTSFSRADITDSAHANCAGLPQLAKIGLPWFDLSGIGYTTVGPGISETEVIEFSRHSTSSSLGMASVMPQPDPYIDHWYFTHVDCPGHADYIGNIAASMHTPFFNRYRPLFAPAIVDIDNRINLNVYSGVTTRSNVFGIWMTVGFFEVNLNTPMMLFDGPRRPGEGPVTPTAPTKPGPPPPPPSPGHEPPRQPRTFPHPRGWIPIPVPGICGFGIVFLPYW